MKLFVVHVNLGCCANNSDGKMFVTAETEQKAREIVNRHTKYPITMVETFDVENEVIYSSFKTDNPYRFHCLTDNWGYLPEQYVRDHHMNKTYLESWQRSYTNW